VVALQLYTVRSEFARDPDATLARVAEIGFRQVELVGLVASETVLAELLPKHGLSAPAAHAGLLRGELDDALAAASRLGVGTVIDPYVDPARWRSVTDIEQTAAQLNEAAERAEQYGITVGYHNHHFELESMIDGRHALEVFADLLAPEVVLELDTYWAAAGGADVFGLLDRLGDRVTALHIKDGDGTLDTKAQVAVGAGIMPVRDILAAAPGRLVIVELDDFAGDMFDAVSDSFRFLERV
jgi:sugar phosphate isomerase/epimerase